MQWSNPLTDDQLKLIDPILHRIAVKFSMCEADRLDYVQTAYLALFDGKRKWKNPLVAAIYAMIDYYNINTGNNVKKPIKIRYSGGLESEAELFGYEQKDVVQENEFRQMDWLGLGLDDREKKIITMFWLDDYTQAEIATHFDIPTSTVSRWINDIKSRIQKKFKEF